MKCSLDISDFLEEISSLSHSVLFLYFFALITEKGFLISSCYSLELCIQILISAGVQPPQDPGEPEGKTALVNDLERDQERILKIRK